MGREVKLSRVDDVLSELSYPTTRDDAAGEFEDVTLLLADGERNLGEVVSNVPETRFEAMDELADEINNALPREAVGEPYQSEGEG
ncbi:DUF5789 family protein [Halorussus halophilus]|uniref:DUF5789 family protein n=1 Tax=Halorussus halophilus TaxID=2650975 RepID=UPI001301460F|nr:hypothetical protein [Halorussus halophilus]